MAKMNIKTDDTVIVLSGDDKKTKGKVIATSPKEGKVIVKDVHIVHKHVKARKQGDTSSIVDTEGAIYASKVALYCPNCKKSAYATAKTADINSIEEEKRNVKN